MSILDKTLIFRPRHPKFFALRARALATKLASQLDNSSRLYRARSKILTSQNFRLGVNFSPIWPTPIGNTAHHTHSRNLTRTPPHTHTHTHWSDGTGSEKNIAPLHALAKRCKFRTPFSLEGVPNMHYIIIIQGVDDPCPYV